MAEHGRDFFDDLEHEIVDATRADNRRRRRRRTARAGTPLALAIGVTALAFGGVPGGWPSGNPLLPVAQAAATTSPAWGRLEVWRYAMNTSVTPNGVRNTGTYTLNERRRTGAGEEFTVRQTDEQGIAQTTRELAQGLKGVQKERMSTGRSESPTGSVLPVPADEFPTSVEGVESLVRKTAYGSTCGEKAMHLAADALSVPGLQKASRRAMVLAIGNCSDVQVRPNQRDPMGREGTTVTAVGEGNGLRSESALTLDVASGEPLSLVERTAGDAPKLGVATGTVLTAAVYRYDGR